MSYERPRTLPGRLHVPDGRVVDVRVEQLGWRRALVEGLSGLVIRAGSPVVLMLADAEGDLPLPGRLDWIANRSGILLSAAPHGSFRRVQRIIDALDRLHAAAVEDDRELG